MILSVKTISLVKGLPGVAEFCYSPESDSDFSPGVNAKLQVQIQVRRSRPATGILSLKGPKESIQRNGLKSGFAVMSVAKILRLGAMAANNSRRVCGRLHLPTMVVRDQCG